MAPLAVFIVFFGPSPPWMPLTLHSMSLNAQVKFVVIGDAAAPDVVPPNVVFERISYAAMQARLSQLLLPGNTSSVRYNWTYKANDIKPFAPALYPQHVAGYEWWAWADMDMVFGDLLRFMAHAVTRPACCKVQLRADGQPQSANKVNVYQHKEACPCDPGAQVNVISPLYPNPWRKKVWGPPPSRREPLRPWRAWFLRASVARPFVMPKSGMRGRRFGSLPCAGEDTL